MSKKILKRSLALGALMAFVITGSAMAGEVMQIVTPLKEINVDKYDDFKSVAGLDGIGGSGWSAFYPKTNSNTSDKLVTEGDITYSSGSFGLYAAYLIQNDIKDYKHHLDNPNDNILVIKHNLTVENGEINLYAAHVGYGKETDGVLTAKRNFVYVGEENNDTTIKSGAGIHIGGAFGNNDHGKWGCTHNVEENSVIVQNVKFDNNGNDVTVYGARTRNGNATINKVLIRDTYIKNANIAGGYVTECSGIADGNTVNIEGNSKIAGKVYGGYSDNGTASGNTINIMDTADVSEADLFGDNDAADGTGNTLKIAEGWQGAIGSVQNFDAINMEQGANVAFNKALNSVDATVNVNGAVWNIKQADNKVGTLNCTNGKIVFGASGHLDIGGAESGEIILTESGKTADDLNTAEDLTTVAEKLGVHNKDVNAKVVMAEGAVRGETTGRVTFEIEDDSKNNDTTNEAILKKQKDNDNDTYYHGIVNEVTEKANTTNSSISEMHSVALMAWRAENNDMNKRLGELRDANGEHGAWVRMTRGESEYKSVKNQYNAYQMGYDQKVGDWTVGTAVTYTEADTGFAKGNGENKHTGLALYGSKLNNDGTYVDLIAKYAKLDHEYNTTSGIGSGDYDTDGFALSAEYGKRIEKGNGLWIEPQVELTYGLVDSVDFKAANGTVSLDDMNSLVGRIGFRAGKDIAKGNVYVRASYLYDFEGETDITFSDGQDTRKFEQDLGGGWWELGIGTNINLSKATYIYADVEHACGGEVDTDWQWNLGVRYSF